MLRILNYTRNALFRRSNIREQEYRQHGLATQATARPFILAINDCKKPGVVAELKNPVLNGPPFTDKSSYSLLFADSNFITRHLQNGDKGPGGHLGRAGLGAALFYGALLLLVYHHIHDRLSLTALVRNFYFGSDYRHRQHFDSSLPDYCCPLVLLKDYKSAHAQPLKSEQAQVSLQQVLWEQKKQASEVSLPLKNDDEEATSDYCSQEPSRKQEIFPSPLSQEETNLIQLEQNVIPLEMEALGAILSLRQGEGADRLKLAAKSGSPTGLFYLGMAYDQGLEEVGHDPSLAMALYREAAAGGHPEAMYNLAVSLLQESANSEEGMRLLQESCKLGVKEARQALKLYPPSGPEGQKKKDAKGPTKNKELGKSWYQQGLHWEHLGERADWPMALDCYSKGAQAGHKKANKRYQYLMKHWKSLAKVS